jgi:pimeloyl-ACP methyl ester carboxylesterase
LVNADAAVTVEEAFDRFATWCDTAADCALQGQDVAAVYDALVRRAQKHPIPVEGALRPVSGDDIRMNTPGYLIAKTPNVLAGELSWALFSQILKLAVAGNAEFFAFPPPNSPTDNLFARIANHCGDYASDINSYADMQQRIEMGRQLAPHLHGASEFWQGMLCVGWPFTVANPVHRLDIRGVPTLIVHTNHDPSLSYQWAFELATQIRRSSVLTRNGDGHTSYYTSKCAQVATDQFLLTKQSDAAPVCAR